MAIHSLTDITSVIKQQQRIDAQEKLTECLAKAEALACITSCEGFLDSGLSVIASYLRTLEDILTEARNLNKRILNTLLKDYKNINRLENITEIPSTN